MKRDKRNNGFEDGSKFRDAFTVSGPLEEFLQRGSRVMFQRATEICEGTATIERIDKRTKTIYFSNPLPPGIKPGDLIRR
jgi:hypothetical protein